MSTASLFDAKPYDFEKARRRRNLIITIIVVAVVIGALLFWFRNWPEEHRVDTFFTALQHKDYEKAYGIWMNDANWKQHPQQYARYPFQAFMSDWGPDGDWGIITSHHVDDAVKPSRTSHGVVVVTTVNDRKERSCVYVDKRDKTISFPPLKTLDCK